MKRKKRRAEKPTADPSRGAGRDSNHGSNRGPNHGRYLPFLLAGLYGLSGFCILALETLWMHEVSLWAGNTVVAATLVIAVFFLAAALGNWLGAALVQCHNRLFLYGCFEMAAALTAGLTFLAGRWIWAHLTAWPLEQVSITILLVGPPSLLSGFAFPILASALVANSELRTIKAGPLYGMNLLGASLGVISGGVLLPWWIGLSLGFALVTVLQLAGGMIAFFLLPRDGDLPAPESKNSAPVMDAGIVLLALSGLLSLAGQFLLIQWARQVLQGSVFVITAVLAVFIGGLGLGSLLAAILRRRGLKPLDLLAVFATLSAALLLAVPIAGNWLIGLDLVLRQQSPWGLLMASLGWSLLALLPLTIFLGGIFPVAWELAEGGAVHQGAAMGRMLAINKTGAGLGAALAVFVLLPRLGLIDGANAIAVGYAAIALAAMIYHCRRLSIFALLIIPALVAIGQHSLPPSTALGLKPEENFVAGYNGCYGPVAVIEKKGSRQILLNSRQHLSGTQRAMSSQLLEGWVPLLFYRQPERVATIGMAAGITSNAMLDYPIRELDAIELVPEVVRAAQEQFVQWNQRLFSDPRAKIIVGDGRVELARLPGKFDAIVCDLFFPVEDATANLYSRDFFQRAKEHLQPDGVFCLWLPCYQHDDQSAGMVIRTFMDVFPNAVLVRSNLDPLQPVIGLLGSGQPIPVSHDYLEQRLASLAQTTIPQQSPFFRSPENAALLFAGDLRSAKPGFSDFPIITDDHPLFSFIGPREPQSGHRLIGIPFLNWIGRRFLQPDYPSCDLGDTPPADVLSATRAANYYLAAAIADTTLPGDKRTEEMKDSQYLNAMQRAQALSPKVNLPQEALGQ